MIPMLIGVFLFLLFLVAIILSAKTWRGWHIAVASVTFIATMILVVCAAMSVKTHVAWRKVQADIDKKLTSAKHEGDVLAFGESDVVKSAEPSLYDIRNRVSRLLLDRGRAWRQCTPSAPVGNSIVVTTIPPETPEDQVKPNGIDANMVLYAFKEVALDSGMKVPVVYLGEYQVSKADERSVTLQPTMPLDGVQQRHVADRSATWSLYEMMPLDSHYIFSDQDMVGQPLDDTDKPIFGEMNEQMLRKIFSMVIGRQPEDPLISEMVADYVKDGHAAADQDVSAHPEDIWRKLEFEKAHKERVDSNNLDPGMSGNFFDPEGYAEVTRLRRGGEAEFRVNDIGVFPYCYDEDKRLVDSLISDGTCRNLGPYYVRGLHDYEEAFHDIQKKFVKRQEDIRRVNRDIQDLNESISSTQQQTAYRQEERAKLQTDQDKVTTDRQQVTKLAEQLVAQKQTLQKKLSQLFQTNLALNQQLTEMNRLLTEDINRRTAEATVQVQ